ncbi:hypothetical protein CEXT_599181 [Caerostris extrusa]|uniref:Uncharacterized protein n=1 Tax=Caerostris extrusa TaxID=172846 RepID=A0AAV4S9Q5_CAEEX|nr:hypothetical protein CEXT_599181 [Caerostris extrusa]
MSMLAYELSSHLEWPGNPTPSLYPGGGKFLDSEEKGLKDLPDIIWWSRIPGIPQREGIPELISHPAASGRKS